MAKDESTVYGGGTTLPDGTETKPDTGMTLPDSGAAALKDAARDAGAQVVSIEKGGLLLDTYRVETDAIAGGMGRVWRVRHTGWETDLAMKQPKAELFRTEQQKENFIRECDAWINLGLHPHIVSCYYVREIVGVPAIFPSGWTGAA